MMAHRQELSMKPWFKVGLFLVCFFCGLTQASYYILINGQDLTEAVVYVGQTAVVSFGSTDTTPPGPDYYWGAGSMQANDSFSGKCDWTGNTVLPAAGPGVSTYHFAPPYEGGLQLTAPHPSQSGIWFTGTYLAKSVGEVTLQLGWYNPSVAWVVKDTVVIHQRAPQDPNQVSLLAQWEGDSAGLADNDKVTFLYDRSDNGYHMYQGEWQNPSRENDYRPVMVPQSLNGHAVVQFDGGQYLECQNLTNANDPQWNLAGACTWFVVLNQFYPDPWPANESQSILSVCYGDIDPDQSGSQTDNYGTWGVRSLAQAAGGDRWMRTGVMAARPGNWQSGNDYAEEITDAIHNPVRTQSGWRVVWGVWDNTLAPVTVEGQLDGGSDDQKGSPGPQGDSGTTMDVSQFIGAYLGARSTEAVSMGVPRFFRGQIAEVRIYNQALYPDRRQQIVSELRGKYGLELHCGDSVNLRALTSEWLSPEPLQADFHADQQVNLLDFAALASVWNTPCARPKTYYVAQTGGSDSYNGLYPSPTGGTNGPFKTIQKAAATLNWGDTCYIRNGTYRETVQPLHGGTTYKNYNGESPIISGCDLFTPQTGYSWGPYSGSIYVCQTTQTFEQLFVDGRMMNEARWPNCDVDQMIWAAKGLADSGTDKYHLVDADLPTPLHGGTWVGAKIWINSGWQWTPFTKTISGYTAGNSLTFGDTSWTWPEWESWFLPRQGNPYYLFGSRAGLDRKEEWVLESNAGYKLCYLWTSGNDSPNAHLVEVKKRDHGFLADEKSCLVIDGLRFFACGVEIQGGTSANNVIRNCRFKYLNHLRDANDRGLSYLYGEGSNRFYGINNAFQNNRVYLAAGHGLYNQGQNTLITNNRFYGTGYLIGASALSHNQASVYGSTSGNTIESCGQNGIDGYINRMAITHNLIHDTMQYCHDGGCIYTAYNQGHGAIIAYNMCYNALNTGVGIYLDWYSTGTIVHHNKIWSCSSDAIRLNSPSEYNSIYNNTCADGTRSLGFAVVTDPCGVAIDSMLGTVIQNNIFNGSVELSTVKPPVYSHNVYTDAFDAWLYPRVGTPAYDGGIAIDGFTCPGDAHPDCGAFDHSHCGDWTWGSNLDTSWW